MWTWTFHVDLGWLNWLLPWSNPSLRREGSTTRPKHICPNQPNTIPNNCVKPAVDLEQSPKNHTTNTQSIKYLGYSGFRVFEAPMCVFLRCNRNQP